VVADQPQANQVIEQISVVGVAGERLGVGAQQVTVEVREHGELIVPADAGEHRRDPRVGERGVARVAQLGHPMTLATAPRSPRLVFPG
jgi:hypothetical protein